MRKFLSCCFLLISQTNFAQTDSGSVAASSGLTHYAVDEYHNILRYDDPVMYLAYPFIQPIVDRKVPLQDGEGKGGFLAEGRFAYRFVIFKGKYYSYPFLQRIRLTFDVDLTLRLANDYSIPMLPTNDKIGFGLDFLMSSLDRLTQKKSTIFWTSIQAHHYSNGQSDSFFTSGPIQRNNYKSGDFSTNYCRIRLNMASYTEKNLFIGAVGYQRDFDPGGPFERTSQLENYYGDDRILVGFQWTHKPAVKEIIYKNRATTTEDDVVKLRRRTEISYRTELEYILGDVSKFEGNNKWRAGWHNYITYMPSVTNEVGFLIHTYVGRDYLNIRFDDIVFIGELGVYVKFNTGKY